MSEPLLTVKEVASWLGESERNVARRAESGQIPAFKPGKKWFFLQSKLDEWAANQIQSRSVRPCRKGKN